MRKKLEYPPPPGGLLDKGLLGGLLDKGVLNG